MTQTRLSAFYNGKGIPDAPLVMIDRNGRTIHAPGGEGKVAGHIGVDAARDGGWAYVSRKERRKHYYRRAGGYAISKSILRILMRENVHTLYWVEDGGDRTLEYGIKQYVEESSRVPHAPNGDPQVVVPANDARFVWHDHDPIHDLRQ